MFPSHCMSADVEVADLLKAANVGHSTPYFRRSNKTLYNTHGFKTNKTIVNKTLHKKKPAGAGGQHYNLAQENTHLYLSIVHSGKQHVNRTYQDDALTMPTSSSSSLSRPSQSFAIHGLCAHPACSAHH